MSDFEYSVVPAPTRGEKTRDAKTPGDRYAVALTLELNRMARDGWEYVRADVLPSEERSGLTGRSTVYHNLLVFRRAVAAVTGGARSPQPEYPAAASPLRTPEPVPALPEAAAPLPNHHSAGVATEPALAEATPPAPRGTPSQG